MRNRDEIRRTLSEILEEVTGDAPGRLTDPTHLYHDVGIDSVDEVRVIMELESQFGICLEYEDLNRVRRVGDLVDVILYKLDAAPQAVLA